MVKLRLRRRGRKKHPFYDIVAIDGRARRDGASIERVGYIDPMTSPKFIELDTTRALYWLGVGAQPTEVVRQILSREGVLLRRALTFKGKSEAEIEAAVTEHKKVAAERYTRLKTRRAERKAKPVEAATEEAASSEQQAASPVAEAAATPDAEVASGEVASGEVASGEVTE